MKKIILLSMIASGMLLASTVTDLTTNVDNEINNGISPVINNSNVSQGHTIVSGDSSINDLGITQTANKITDTGIDSSTLNQGLTHINNGDVSKSTLESTNSIEGSSVTMDSTVNQASTKIYNGTVTNIKSKSTNAILESSITDSSTLSQASTIVNGGAELEDTTVTSNNGLVGIITHGANVSQATLELNGEGTELDGDSVIDTENTIVANVDASEVHQSRVRIGGGYKVSTLIMSETNTLLANVTGGSNVEQGGLDVCAHDGEGDASDWCE